MGRRWTYDVFLSFRGEDTRKNFVDHLYTAFEIRGIYTFKDDQRLLTGEPISKQLPAAIEESRFAVVVFSERYADSAWCLDELAHVRDCRKEIRQTVIPVFYNVQPYVVRRQTKSYEVAFGKHETRYENEKIKKWKDALFEIAGLSGFDVSNTFNGHESACITAIVQEISSKCPPILNYEANLVALNTRVKDLKSLLGTELDVRFVGIWGIGGSGKTTLAWAVYNEIGYQFDGKCFVENVKELSRQYLGLQLLQEKIISNLLFDKSLKVNNVREGIGLMGSRLQRRKVLLVLDDVDDYAQLDALAGSHEWFGKGSRIIITTRDQRWLTRPTSSIEMYNASLLNQAESIKLFSLYAFGKDSPPEEFRDDTYYLVRKAGGFPLALKVLGSSLYDSTMDEWKSSLSRLEVEGEDEVSKMLQVTYDGLGKIDQKILLDIACFFKGEKTDRVTRILDSFDFHAHFGIKRLVQRSLIYIINRRIHMHDRIQEMGWNIVRQSSDKPGEHSRLWLPHDVCHVLAKNTGTDAVEGIYLSFVNSGQEAIKFDTRSFKSMNKLRLLIVDYEGVVSNKHLHRKSQTFVELNCFSNLRWLSWPGYNFDSLPEFCGTAKLVGLEMAGSKIVQLWDEQPHEGEEVPNGKKNLDKLRYINLIHSYRLKCTPDLKLTPNLHTLILEGCGNLVDVHPSIGDHEQLVSLSLKGCSELQSLPSSIEMKSLETLILSNCNKLRTFPDVKGNMKKLSKLYLNDTAIEELPASIENLSGLVLLDLTQCTHLTSLPSTICKLECLKTLYATHCYKLRKLPKNLGQIQSLEDLSLEYTPIREAPSSMVLLKNLKTLTLGGCVALRSMLLALSTNSSCFRSIRSLFLNSCNLSDGDIPADLSPFTSLEELNLSHNPFKYLPEGLCQLPRLKILDVSWCQNLEVFEALLPSGIAILNVDQTAELSSSFPDLSVNYDSLWKISYCNDFWSAEQPTASIMKSLLKGLLVANHRFSLLLRGCYIPEWFGDQSPDNHMYTQLPLNWYREDILGFAISTVFCYGYYRGYMDIQFNLIEECNWQHVPQTSTHELSDQCCIQCKVWVGFISFSFFQLLFPEYQLDDWSTFTGTLGVSFPVNFMWKHCAIRPVYKEDVERVPTNINPASLKSNPTGRPWLQHSLNDEDMDSIRPNHCTIADQIRAFSSSTTAYLKERGHRHARLLFTA